MKLGKFIEMVKALEDAENYDPDAEVKLHGRFDKNLLLFDHASVGEKNILVLKDKTDIDLAEHLKQLFNKASEEQIDELDFYMDLLDTGFTLEDLENAIPEYYPAAKMFMEKHGLI